MSPALLEAQCLPRYVNHAFRQPSCHLKIHMQKNNMMLAPTRRMVCSSAQRKQHCYFAAHSTSKGAIEGLAAQSCKGFNAVLNLMHLIYWMEADLQFTLPPRREQLESGFYRRFFCKTRPKMCASNTVGLKKKQWNKRLGLKTAEK